MQNLSIHQKKANVRNDAFALLNKENGMNSNIE